MDDSGAILCQISSFKDMLDQVNEEIESSIQVTREIESEIVKCSEFETALAAREAELTKMVYMLDFEINGLVTVAADSRCYVNLLEEKLCNLRAKRNEISGSTNNTRELFISSCLAFQKNIEKAQSDTPGDLLAEKELLENEIYLLSKKQNSLLTSMSAFVEEVLEDINDSNSALLLELENGKIENEKLLRDIDELKATLLSAIPV